MKSSRRLPVIVVVVMFALGGSVVLLFRHSQPKPSEVSLVTVKEPVLMTNLEPSASVAFTNPPNTSAARTPSPEDRRLTSLQLMKDFLDLTDEQAEKLDPILQEHKAKITAFRRETALSRPERMAKLKEIQTASDAKIKAVLTPEQAEKWRQRGQNLQQPRQVQASNPS